MGQDSWAPATPGYPTGPGATTDVVGWFEQAVQPYLASTPQASAASVENTAGAPDYSRLATLAHPPGTAVVQIGDDLPALAARYLHDPSRWPEIYALNRDQILDPSVILPGMILKLPEGTRPVQEPSAPPAPPPLPAPEPPLQITGNPRDLEKVTTQQLAYLGQHDRAQFLEALKPAAMATQAQFGVPWQVTLAQAALESGWGQHAIGGYNLFGIKGRGPAGSVSLPTREWQDGHYVSISASFARYDNFYQAIWAHGELFHNGHYQRALADFSQTQDPARFAQDIQGIYATSPTYASNLLTIMNQYHLE